MNWALRFGLYPGIVVRFISYEQEKFNNHVLYLPFIDICLTIIKKGYESD